MSLLLVTLAAGLFAGLNTGLDNGLNSRVNSDVKSFPNENEFQKFIQVYGKSYIPGSMEYYKRLSVFKSSIDRSKWLNRPRRHPKSALYGITRYSDLTKEEFEHKLSAMLVKKQTIPTDYHELQEETATNENEIQVESIPTSNEHRRLKRSVEIDNLKRLTKDLPQKVDWRKSGVVSGVHDQGKCGACWAFSTIETIESMVAITYKSKLVDLSIQQVVDCATEDNHGCDGGDTCAALVWMSENNVRIQTAQDYPLRDDAGQCRAKNPSSGIQIATNFTCDNYTNNEVEIVKYLANHGPLVAAVDATSWQDYLGGIIQFHCENNRNHAVQIVGYDLTGDIPYYIIRNSWGKLFGLDGYLHIAIGKNLCGIAEEISAVYVL